MDLIPVNAPVIPAASKRYVQEALETGWISSAGPFIQKFEEAYAWWLGVHHAITCSNGTAALHLALASLNVGKGDEVLLPDFTMGACLDAVLYTGATPVFCDVDASTFTMDPLQAHAKISKNTKAIMPVHIYGHSADMGPILAMAKEHSLAVVEDAAESHGGTYNGNLTGSLGTLGCFSFYGNKILTTGEGGMVVTNDDALAQRIRSLKDLAHSPEKRFWHTEMAWNYRMTNMQAALGLGMLESLPEFLKTKQWMAGEYEKQLSDITHLQLPVTKPGVTNVYWMYAVLVRDSSPFTRDQLRTKLHEHGVDTRDFFYPLHAQPFAAAHHTANERFPVTEDLARRGFYLPSGLALTQEQIDTVCSTLHELLA